MPFGPISAAAPAGPAVDGDDGKEYLSVRELAERIPYSEGSIRNLMSQGRFRRGVHYVKPGGRVAFRWSAIRAWLDEQQQGP
jgi:predicted DNA-binding transcriptional regulator AlpA